MPAFSGSIPIVQEFTQTTGEWNELRDWLRDRLLEAGWTGLVLTGGMFKFESAPTPQGLKMRVQVGSSAQAGPGDLNIIPLRTDESMAPADWPVVSCWPGRRWFFWANQYQAWLDGFDPVRQKSFAFWGVLNIPAPLPVPAHALFGIGNTGLSGEQESVLNFHTGPIVHPGWGGCYFAYGTNAITWVSGQNIIERPRLAFFGPLRPRYCPGTLWDGCEVVSEPFFVASAVGGEKARLCGKLWDSVIYTGRRRNYRDEILVGGRTYIVVQNVRYLGADDFYPYLCLLRK